MGGDGHTHHWASIAESHYDFDPNRRDGNIDLQVERMTMLKPSCSIWNYFFSHCVSNAGHWLMLFAATVAIEQHTHACEDMTLHLYLEHTERVEASRLDRVTGVVFIADDDDVNEVGDTDIAQLADMPNLISVTLTESKITSAGLTAIMSLKKLTAVDVSYTLIDDGGLSRLSKIQPLEYLSLCGTRITSGGLRHIAALRKLRRLELLETAIDDTALTHLARLKQLEHLNLTLTEISDKSIDKLSSMTKLRVLSINGTRITEEGVEQLKVALPETKIYF